MRAMPRASNGCCSPIRQPARMAWRDKRMKRSQDCPYEAAVVTMFPIVQCNAYRSTMSENLRRAARALVSVSDKSGVVDFGRALAGLGIELISTGGTRKILSNAGLKVLDVSELTGFPEMMDGRVKTLHPAVHGGLLAKRGNSEHMEAMRAHKICPIDIVVVNLYPFEATVAGGGDFAA